MYTTTYKASTLSTTQPTTPKQRTNHQQRTQHVTMYHKLHTCLANLWKRKKFEKKSHNTHNTKTSITNIPTIKPIQPNLTTPTRARPTGLAHKKEITYTNKIHYKHKKLISPKAFHTNYPNPNPPLTTNPHNNSNNHKTKKTPYIPKTTHKPSSLHTHNNKETPPPIKVKAKHYKHKKLKITYKKHKVHLLLLRCGDIETNPGPMPNILTKHPPSHKQRNKTYFIPFTIKLQPEYQHLAKEFSPSLNTTHPRHLDSTTTYPHLSRYITYTNITHHQ